MGLISRENNHRKRVEIRNEMYKAEDLEYALGFVTVWGIGVLVFVGILFLL